MTGNTHVGIFTGAVTISVAAGVWWWYWLKRKKGTLQAQPWYLTSGPHLPWTDNVHLVTTAEEWNNIYPKLMKDIKSIKVLGFDCEWVTLQGFTRPVSLLQLSTPSRLCVLVRLLHMETTPDSLRDLLADKRVLKVGVSCLNDARKLMKDHALLVQGCVDLRHMTSRCGLHELQGGLKTLSGSILGVDLDKVLMIRAGNWELECLDQQQVDYAAMDAIVGVGIFLALVSRKLRVPPTVSLCSLGDEEGARWWNKILSVCQGVLDVPYKNVNNYKHIQATVAASGGSSGWGASQGGAREKPAGRAYSARTRPLYHNCQMKAPDGQLLCTCDLKKAEWYLEKGLAKKIGENPLTLQLTFEPSGRPLDHNSYYLQDKENVCVVCGKDESYLKKNIVPHEYRKYFPPVMKDHRSHDVLLVCAACHQRSNSFDVALKNRFERECGAPIGTKDGVRFREDHDLLQVRSAAKALLMSRSKIPRERQEHLEQVIRNYYGTERIDDSVLIKAVEIHTKIVNKDYQPHGVKVIEHYIENEGLVAFERMWRQHFVETMKPQFLPSMWSVNHSHDELATMEQTISDSIASGRKSSPEGGDTVERSPARLAEESEDNEQEEVAFMNEKDSWFRA